MLKGIASALLILFLVGLAVAISTMAYGVFGFVSNQLTPIITGSSLQLHGFLYIVAGESLAAALFVFFALPETKVRQR